MTSRRRRREIEIVERRRGHRLKYLVMDGHEVIGKMTVMEGNREGIPHVTCRSLEIDPNWRKQGIATDVLDAFLRKYDSYRDGSWDYDASGPHFRLGRIIGQDAGAAMDFLARYCETRRDSES